MPRILRFPFLSSVMPVWLSSLLLGVGLTVEFGSFWHAFLGRWFGEGRRVVGVLVIVLCRDLNAEYA